MRIDSGLALHARAEVLLVQGEDPWQDPTGGMVTSTKCLLRAFGERVAVASPSDEALPVGVWLARPFEGRDLAYFNLGPLGLVRGRRPLIPAKVHVYRRVKPHMKALHACGPHNLLMDCAEVLFSARRFAWDSVCYMFPGLANPVADSRYPWARIFGGMYERMLVRSLCAIRPEAIAAAADERAIEQYQRGPGRILESGIWHSLPTRVDPGVFYTEPQDAARVELGLPLDDLILVVCGRLSRIKGWRLHLEVLDCLSRNSAAVRLVFVGDGEDRNKILRQAMKMGLAKKVSITGLVPQHRVRRYLNAGDVCVVGSLVEGWSHSMLEALACGKPLVSTDVSGARAMIREGHNGFVVMDRDPQLFAAAVRRAADLADAGSISLEIAERYSVDGLAQDIGRIWKPLAR